MLGLLNKTVLSIALMGSSLALADVRIQGAGSSFVNPIMQKWVTEYQKAHPDIKIDYQSIGSGGGIKSITEKTVDFADSDAPLSKKQMEALGGKGLEIPCTAGAVVMAYNLPGVSGDLKLTGEVIAAMFDGKINKWNDSKITELNPGVNLPDMAVTPCWRTDGSGTNFVFTNYLGTQSEDFKENVGMGMQVKWPVGQGGKGNDGVTAAVQGTPGAIGYIELNFALSNHIPFALLKNKEGKFVKASPETVSAAGAGAVDKMNKRLAVGIWNQPGDDAYPIASFTYLVLYNDLSNIQDDQKAQALKDFLMWVVSEDGQKLDLDLQYSPLASTVQEKAKAAVAGLTHNGQAIK
ncbi:MAG: phosphate ABC transporter substrate-binding protein PstS [Tepidisphaeraceae bacterium]